jgi:hypothetical protein
MENDQRFIRFNFSDRVPQKKMMEDDTPVSNESSTTRVTFIRLVLFRFSA